MSSRSKDTYLAAKYRRIATRRGPVIAIVALEHVVLVSIWNMITNDREYRDPGGDYFTRRNPDKAKSRAIDQLRAIGYDVTLTPQQLSTPRQQ